MSGFSVFIICATLVFIVISVAFFSDNIVSGIENLMRNLSLWSRQDFRTYCGIRGIYNETTFIRKSGALTSIIRLKGAKSIIGNEEYSRLFSATYDLLNNRLHESQAGGTDIQIVFQQDPNTSRVLDKISSAVLGTLHRLGLSMDDYFRSEVESIAKVSHDEDTFIVITTNSMLKDEEAALERRKEFDRIDAANIPKDWTNPDLAISVKNPLSDIEERHETTVRAFLELDTKLLWMELMTVDDALKMIKMTMSSNVHPDWMPRLPGRKQKPSFDIRDKNSPPFNPIWSQIAPKVMIEDDKREDLIEVDGIWYGVLWVDVPPRNEQRFTMLSDRISDIPYRISIHMWPAGLNMVKFNKMLVELFSLFPKSFNRRIKDAINDMKQEAIEGNQTLGVAITAATWAPDRKTCIKQLMLLQSRMQGWGGCDVETQCGDGIELLMSTIPALHDQTPAKVMPMTTYSIAQMLPYFTPASVWDVGSVLYVAQNGKIMPFSPGSSEQKTWNYLFFAPPGSGKSAMLNTIEIAMCMAPGQQKMPRIVVIDIGDTVEGPINLISSSLPEHRKSEALFVKLRMRPEYSFNIFDTERGFRFPTPMGREFVVNFVTTIATPANSREAPPKVFELVGMLVDEAYRKFSDKESPKIYEPNVSELVDEGLKRIGYVFDTHTSWWEVTDALFNAGMMRESEIAQRYAMPTLSDLPMLLTSPAIRDLYGNSMIDGENLLDFVNLMISSVLRDYPIFGRPTQFDIGQARFVGIDLNDVRGSGDSGKKQTALMYLFAMGLATRNFFVHKDMLKDIPDKCPEIYRSFHIDRINETSEELKSLFMDEFHNTGGLTSIRRMVSTLNLEGRKFKILVGLSSQFVEHFDDNMVDSATGIFIMSCDSPAMAEKLGARFGLSQSAIDALNTVNRVGQFMGIFKTKNHGTTINVLSNTLSPIKYWAFSSTGEDKRLREIMYNKLHPSVARQVMAEAYPMGVQKEYERRRMMMGETGDETNTSIIEGIAEELLEDYHQSIIRGKRTERSEFH